MLKQILVLILFIIICFAVAGIGSLFTMPSIADWYAMLKKPGWTPPSWLFGPVWTVLYLSMAVAAWLVWRQVGFKAALIPMVIFTIQLTLNLLWSIIFFGKHNIGLAMADIVLLWLSIAATIFVFRQVNNMAGLLLVPYLLWVTFAAALNLSIWNLNR